MNKCILMGRLTRDPEVRYTKGRNNDQMAIAKFSLAVDRRFKSEDKEADFFECTCFGKLGEITEKYLTKGSKVLVTGRLQNDNYTNKKGEKVYTSTVIVEELEFAESKKTDTSKPEPAPDYVDVPDNIANDLPW